MDVNLLSQLLKELILDNDRVSLPGMGSFIADIAPAHFSEDGKTISPPFRRIFFRCTELWNDELVEKYYAEKMNVERDSIKAELNEFFEKFRLDLNVRKSIELPGFGKMRSTKEGNIYFVAEKGLDIYANAFGLEPISLKVLDLTGGGGKKKKEAQEVDSESISDNDLTDLMEDLASPEEAEEDRKYMDEYKKNEELKKKEQADEAENQAVAQEVASNVAKGDAKSEKINTATPSKKDLSPSFEPVSKSTKQVIPSDAKRKKTKHKAWITILIILVVLTIIALLIYILGTNGVLDSFLYSTEDLQTIITDEVTNPK